MQVTALHFSLATVYSATPVCLFLTVVQLEISSNLADQSVALALANAVWYVVFLWGAFALLFFRFCSIVVLSRES
jgi:hypothetical protein